MGNLFEAHKYAVTVPQDTIRALKRKVAEQAFEIGRLEAENEELRKQVAEVEYRFTFKRADGAVKDFDEHLAEAQRDYRQALDKLADS